jgi:hypothetical protein
LTGAAHVDQHAIWFDPTNPSRIYLGNDGGFYSSVNGGSNCALATWHRPSASPASTNVAYRIGLNRFTGKLPYSPEKRHHRHYQKFGRLRPAASLPGELPAQPFQREQDAQAAKFSQFAGAVVE